MVGDSQDIVVSALTEGFCSDFVYLKLVCVKALGEEIGFSSRWASEGTAEVETEAEIWHSWVVWYESMKTIQYSSDKRLQVQDHWSTKRKSK